MWLASRTHSKHHDPLKAQHSQSGAEVQAEPLVTMGSLARLLLVAGGFLGMQDWPWPGMKLCELECALETTFSLPVHRSKEYLKQRA